MLFLSFYLKSHPMGHLILFNVLLPTASSEHGRKKQEEGDGRREDKGEERKEGEGGRGEIITPIIISTFDHLLWTR